MKTTNGICECGKPDCSGLHTNPNEQDKPEVMIRAKARYYQIVLVQNGKVIRTRKSGLILTFRKAKEVAENWALENSYYTRRQPLLYSRP